MVLTKKKNTEILYFILEKVFEEEANSDLHKIMAHSKIKSILDIINMEDTAFMHLQYHDDQKIPMEISKGVAGLLRSFKAFDAYCNGIGRPIDDDEWITLKQED